MELMIDPRVLCPRPALTFPYYTLTTLRAMLASPTRKKNKGFNEILIIMKLHICHLRIQFAIAGVLDSPVLVLFSSMTRVTSGSGFLLRYQFQ
jgi:hypothetical protein